MHVERLIEMSHYSIDVPLKVLRLVQTDDKGTTLHERIFAKTSYFEIYKQLREEDYIAPLQNANVETTPDIEYFNHMDNILDRLMAFDTMEWTHKITTI